MRRIVVTGLGAITPLATGVEASWSRLLAGRSGIRRLPDDVAGDLPAKVGGVVPSTEENPDAGFDPDAVLAPKDQRKVDRFILFALAAAEEALAQANWKPDSETGRLRTATIIASGIGGFPAITEAVRTVDLRGVRRLSPFTIPSFLVNLAAGHISIRHGFKGPLGAPVTAIAQAGISPREVRHLNAHATSTPVGDLGEIEAIKSVFGRDFAIAVSATKSATGHLLGAAGGLGAIFAILALRDQVAPPTLNLSAPDPAGDGIDFVSSQARPLAMNYAISNGFGFGGVNASALFRRWTDELTGGSAGGAHD